MKKIIALALCMMVSTTLVGNSTVYAYMETNKTSEIFEVPKSESSIRDSEVLESAPSTEVPEVSESAPSTEVPEEPESALSTEVPEEPESAPSTEVPEEPESAPSTEVPEASESAPSTEVPEEPESAPSTEVSEEPESAPPTENSELSDRELLTEQQMQALLTGEQVSFLEENWAEGFEKLGWQHGGTVEIQQNLRLYSENKLNSSVSLKRDLPEKTILEFKAMQNKYANREQDGADKASLAVKMNFGGTHRLMLSLEEDGFVFCNASSTWGEKITYPRDEQWHTYKIEADNTKKKANLFVDDQPVTEILLQERAASEGIEFWVNGTASAPAEAFLGSVSMYRELGETDLPLWREGSKVSVIEKSESTLKVEWDSADNAEKYQIFLNDAQIAEQSSDIRTYQFQDLESGKQYSVKIEAVNQNGITNSGPSCKGSTIYDISSGKMVSQILMEAGDGYNAYRIPSLVTTSKGTLLAVAEARSGGSDWSPMDAVLMRSADGGNTWEERRILAAGLEEGYACNNPVLLATREGPIFLLYCKEYGVESRNGGVFYIKSTDDGVTWSEPVDISASCIPEYRNVIATGPGHGIQLKNGRLITAIWMVPKSGGQGDTSHHPGEVSTLYSDDMGKTWHVGDIISSTTDLRDPNESTLVELSDGRVMINMRNQTGTKMRAVSISPDGSSNWSTPYFDEALNEPVCFGSLLRYDENTILFVNPDTTEGRTRGTVKVSYDDGKTWPVKRMLNEGYSSYADMAVTTVNGEKQINVLMETSPGNSLSLFRFPLSWVEGNCKKGLKKLELSHGNLELKQDIYEYTVAVDGAVNLVTITAEAFDASASLSLGETPFKDGKIKLALDSMETTAEINLKFPSGEETQYNIKFVKEPAVSDESCVLHYTLDELDQGIVEDSSDLKNHGTVYGSVSGEKNGQYNGCSVMGNGETYLQVENGRGLAFGSGDFTASAWIKPSSIEGQQFLFWYGNYVAGSNAWWCRLNGDDIQFLLGDGGEQSITASNVVEVGQWQHVAFVKEANKFKIYLNGELKAEDTAKKAYNVNGENILRIGAQKSNQQRIFKGNLDEIRLYNYALNEKDIELVINENRIVSAAKDILMFTANGRGGKISGNDILLYQPEGTDITKIAPEITVSKKASVSPASNEVCDFTEPVKYTVTAEGGSTKEYIVQVVIGEEQIKEVVYEQPAPVKVYSNSIEQGKAVKINFLGDSITYGQDPKNANGQVKQYHAFLADRIKMDSENYGVRGSTISVLRRGNGRDPFTVRYEKMRDDADVIFVFGGTNDYGTGGAKFGNWQDREDTTFLGGLRVLIEGLIEKYPEKQIVFMTPIQRNDRAGVNAQHRVLAQYVTAIKGMCSEYGIPVLDAYSAPEMNLLVDKDKYISDGLHPSEAGHEIMAKWIYEQLQEKQVIRLTKPVESIILDSEEKQMCVGEQFTLNVRITPEDATDKSVLWRSSDEQVVTVDNGVITAVAPGEAIITVETAEGQLSTDCKVTVTEEVAQVFCVTIKDSFSQVSGEGKYTKGDRVEIQAGNRTGYLFEKWSVESSNVDLEDASKTKTTFLMPGEDVVLKVHWKPEDNKPEDNKPEDNKPEDNKPEDNKPEDNKPEGNKPEDNKPEDNKPEDNKPEGNKPEDNKPEDNKPEDNKPGDNKPSNNKVEKNDKNPETGDETTIWCELLALVISFGLIWKLWNRRETRQRKK